MAKATKKELRSFGLVVGVAFAILGAVMLLRHARVNPNIFFGVAGFLIVFGLVAPGLLRPFHFVWMKLAEVLGYVMNRVILGVIFFILFTLVAVIQRIIRRDRLGVDFKKKQESYWIQRTETAPPPPSYERQF